MKIELKDYTRSNRQHWAILPDDQDGMSRSFIHVDPRLPNSEHVPSRSVSEAPIHPLSMSFIQTAQSVDFSNATVSHVAGNMYNINVYSEPQVLSPTLDVSDTLVPAMRFGLTSSKERTNRIQENTASERLHGVTGSIFQVRPGHNRSWNH
jgi:hypothetical protein